MGKAVQYFYGRAIFLRKSDISMEGQEFHRRARFNFYGMVIFSTEEQYF